MATVAVIPENLVKVFASITKLYADMTGEGNVLFTENGIRIDGMDQSHVSFLRTYLPSTLLHEMGGDYEYHEEDISAGVPFRILSKILSTFTSPTQLVLRVGDDKDTLGLVVRADDKDASFTIRLMEIDSEPLDIPELEYDVSVKIPTKTLQKAIGQAEALEADSVDLVWLPSGSDSAHHDKETLRIRYSTDTVTADVAVYESDAGSPFEESRVSLAVSYPKRFFAVGTMADKTRVAFRGDIPVLFRCEYGEGEDRGFTEMHVAPRIDDTDEDGTDDYENYRD